MAEATAEFTVDVESESEIEEIEDALDDLDGIMGVVIDPETGEGQVHYDVDLQSDERIEITIRELGYDLERTDED